MLAGSEWAMFALSGPGGASDGSLHFVPAIAIAVLDNDEIEEVVFVRDEEANLVWANERLVTLADGRQTRQGEGATPPPLTPPGDTRPVFKLTSEVAPWRIPYVPRFLDDGGVQGDIYLHRGRTVEAATLAEPQYRSRIVAESGRLDEARLARGGVRVRRTKRFARGSDSVAHFSIGRSRQAAPRSDAAGLRFDYFIEPAE